MQKCWTKQNIKKEIFVNDSDIKQLEQGYKTGFKQL